MTNWHVGMQVVCVNNRGLRRTLPLDLKRVYTIRDMAFRHQPETAVSFWQGLSDNDGLRKGDARHTYLRLLSEPDGGRSTAENGARSAAVAWNAFFEGRQLTMIRVMPGKFRIAGTVIRGR